MRFELETLGKNYHNGFNMQVLDLVRVVNANPNLGKLRGVETTADGGKPTSLSIFQEGAPVANVPRQFTRCAQCPNPSYCITQGMCTVAERVRLSETKFPGELALLLQSRIRTMDIVTVRAIVDEALKDAMYDKYSLAPVKAHRTRATIKRR